MKKNITLKELNHLMHNEYIGDSFDKQLDWNTLNRLYSLHNITYFFLENDEKVRDRILKLIKREQVFLENKKYPIGVNE